MNTKTDASHLSQSDVDRHFDDCNCMDCAADRYRKSHPKPLPQNLEDWLDEHTPEIGLSLDKTESFSAWIDSQGDALTDPTSFDEWLRQSEDSI